jgi:hypothetical protein
LFKVRHASPLRPKEFFYPVEKVKSIINEDNLKDELSQEWPENGPGVIQWLSNLIRGIPADGPISGPKKSYRRIFAILVVIKRISYISSFVMHGVSDEDLPLVKMVDENGMIAGFRRKSDNEDAPGLECFASFDERDRDGFETVGQWAMSAPVFERPDGNKVRDYDLASDAILPFVKEEMVSSGGFGVVFRVQIHPEHHNFDAPEGCETFFAIKQLNSCDNDKKAFQDEFAMLSKFSNDAHSHLISLLAAYSHRGRFNLIFPFAKADLSKFWSVEKPAPVFEKAVVWVAEQCAGVTGGLSQIHQYQSRSLHEDSAHPGSSPGGHQGRKLCGRHGDIKPANILWFPDGQESSDPNKIGGTLKLADFGLVEFHSEASCSNRPKSQLAGSPDYRPPECDMTDGKISRSFDIWSLGCVYLEFILWLMDGWYGVRQFNIDRATKSDNTRLQSYDYSYFEFVESGGTGKTAKLKGSVSDVSFLLVLFDETPVDYY